MIEVILLIIGILVVVAVMGFISVTMEESMHEIMEEEFKDTCKICGDDTEEGEELCPNHKEKIDKARKKKE